MLITEVRVTRLFGVFNHIISFKAGDPVRIIYGPNGFGKTTVLRMIAAAATGESGIFQTTPFDEFRIVLDSGTTAVVRRHALSSEHSGKVRLEYLVGEDGGELKPLPERPLDLPRQVLELMDQFIPPPYHLRRDKWVDGSGREYTAWEMLAEFPRAMKAVPKTYREHPLAEHLSDLRVALVEANRLQARPKRNEEAEADFVDPLRDVETIVHYGRTHDAVRSASHSSRVEQYSEELANRISEATKEYARISQELDRTFPLRLIQFLQKPMALDPSKASERMNDLEEKRRLLVARGLLSSEKPLVAIGEQDIGQAIETLTLYLDDTEEKLSAFDDLSTRIGRLVDTVNDHFQYKRLSVTAGRGLRIESMSGDPIRLQDLSSGEQHEIVVLYELLFKMPPGGLLLIDEPEISLHLKWQSSFLDDLIGALDLTGGRALVATHSPAIVGNRRELEIALTAPSDLR